MTKPIQDPEEAAKRLMQEAYQRGSADNITCVVVRFIGGNQGAITNQPTVANQGTSAKQSTSTNQGTSANQSTPTNQGKSANQGTSTNQAAPSSRTSASTTK